jgi:hypothetical protein
VTWTQIRAESAAETRFVRSTEGETTENKNEQKQTKSKINFKDKYTGTENCKRIR